MKSRKKKKTKSRSPKRRSQRRKGSKEATEMLGLEVTGYQKKANFQQSESLNATIAGTDRKEIVHVDSPSESSSSGGSSSSDDTHQNLLSMKKLANMLKKYNHHVSYLESRLAGAEEHIVTLESTIDTLNKNQNVAKKKPTSSNRSTTGDTSRLKQRENK